MNDITEKTSGFVEDLGDAARRNPISAALIGMGVLWLFTSGKSVGRAGDLLRSTGLDHAPEAARRTLDSVKGEIAASSGAFRDAAGSSFDALRARGADAARAMPDPGEIFEATRDNLTELFRTQPLALGVIGLAIGAGIAAALPNTEVEDTYLGEASETVRSKTAELAAQQVETAKTLATNVVDAAAEEARKQGLTLEGAQAAAGDVVAKVSRVADAARKGVSERIS
jgi:hypothetical protein